MLTIFSYASDIGANRAGTAPGPLTLKNSPFAKSLPIEATWAKPIAPRSETTDDKLSEISYMSQMLAEQTYTATKQGNAFVVLGGDHSSGIGTWSGVATALAEKNETLGLIWVDAHLDSHTQHTSHSQNIHGMPIAALLGHGYDELTSVLSRQPKIQPEHIIFIGIRCFETEEEALLKKLGVKIYYMKDVNKQGFVPLLNQAIETLNAKTDQIGISVDLDSLDPIDAPGVSVPEPDGIRAADLLAGLKQIQYREKLVGAEVVEFCPKFDANQKTEKLVFEIINSLLPT